MVIEVIASVVTILVALVGCTWKLATRLTIQDYVMRNMLGRMSRIEKHLGLAVNADDELP